MPSPTGTRVVERDHAVLAALALARYLSYRGASGAPLKAWALTEAGYVLAKQIVPYVAAPASDVGAAFLEHSLLLNDVLVDLIVKVRGQPEEPLSDLPFRWIPENGNDVTFDYYDRPAQRIQHARIRPDATLEIGEPRRRVFLECETGSQTIVSSDPLNTGATWAKIQRYAHLIVGTTGQHETRTPYSLLCPDGATPVLVFVVHSDRRRDAIRKLAADPKRAIKVTVRAYTLQEAADVLGALAVGRRVQAAQPAVVGLTAGHLQLLGAALSKCHATLDEARQTVERHNRSLQEPVRSAGPLRVPESPEALRDALTLLNRLRAAAKESWTPPRNGTRDGVNSAMRAGGERSPAEG